MLIVVVARPVGSAATDDTTREEERKRRREGGDLRASLENLRRKRVALVERLHCLEVTDKTDRAADACEYLWQIAAAQFAGECTVAPARNAAQRVLRGI